MTGKTRFGVTLRLARLRVLAAALSTVLWSGQARAEKRLDASVVPALPKSPSARFVVMPFENRSGILGLEWMRVAVPFVLGERAEGFSRLQPAFGSLVVRRAPRNLPPLFAEAVARYAEKSRAQWVFSGWVRRPDWKLELGVSLYHVANGHASLVAEHVGLGEFHDVHKLIGEALRDIGSKVGIAGPGDNETLLARPSSLDFYAFTLFGRGVGGLLAARTPADRLKAEQILKRTVFIDPKFTEAQRLVALGQARNHKPVLAKLRLERVLKSRPGYAAALAQLATIARTHGQPGYAEEILVRLLRLRPWDLESRYDLGMLQWDAGRGEAAFRQLTIVANAAPKHIGARRALVLIHASRSDTAGLILELKDVVKLAPRDVETQMELGAALVSGGAVAEAIQVYKHIIDLAPSNVSALKFLGDLYRQQGQNQRAIRYYGLAMRAAPRDPRAYFLLANIYVSSGDDLAARRLYLRAQKFPKWRGQAYNNLGAIALRRHRVTQALWYLRRAVTRDASHAGFHYNLALALSKTRAADEALAEIDSALAIRAGDAQSHYLRGVVLLRLGRAEEARDSFRETLALAPDNADAAHNLALLDALKRRATEGAVVGEER